MIDETLVPALKLDTRARAQALGLPILRDGELLGSLVPVGAWILSDDVLIATMAAWRSRSMGFFFAQFESTPAKTERYLREISIAQSDRILFMIEIDSGFVGHIGLANIAKTDAEIDNVMRGMDVSPHGLMSASQRVLTDWAFDVLDLASLYLRVLSSNDRAMALYERGGFVTTERLPLRRDATDDGTVLTPCAVEEATVPWTCDIMTLHRANTQPR